MTMTLHQAHAGDGYAPATAPCLAKEAWGRRRLLPGAHASQERASLLWALAPAGVQERPGGPSQTRLRGWSLTAFAASWAAANRRPSSSPLTSSSQRPDRRIQPAKATRTRRRPGRSPSCSRRGPGEAYVPWPRRTSHRRRRGSRAHAQPGLGCRRLKSSSALTRFGRCGPQPMSPFEEGPRRGDPCPVRGPIPNIPLRPTSGQGSRQSR